ncbi:MAG TPA: 2'-5' RNA ligase family protein [Ohtaekwangia sp.]|uniref:2'-5' RNA ligase family protein n=1 Tax=Ohtaekwangia sp. TaxID=2066019 RepID=UPI002F93DD7E
MQSTRQQLTLFVTHGAKEIEKIRAAFNPQQHALIAAHVTLCREDEITPIEKVIDNIHALQWSAPLRIAFNPVERFEGGKGVLIPPRGNNEAFHTLRREVLKGIHQPPRLHQPHITLMHPRNATCTDAIFDQLTKYSIPSELMFDTISLIGQHQGGKWIVQEEYRFLRV